MNGGVNGTMDESSEATVSEASMDQKNDTTEECDIPKPTNTNLDVDESSKNELQKLDNTDMGGGDCHSDEADRGESKHTDNENSSHEEIENNCENSNESGSENIHHSPNPKPHSADNKPLQNGDADNKSENKTAKVTPNIDSEDSSEDDDGSVVSANRKAEDTVSINSDSDDNDDTSQESQEKRKNDNGPHSVNGDSLDSISEVHDITSDNDDCILTNEDKPHTSDQPRRSSRAIKRKSYSEDILNGDDEDDESEIEEIDMTDPLEAKSAAILICDARSLVDMSSKKMKTNQKDRAMVIIRSNMNKEQSNLGKNTNVQNLYQDIVARGTTVTPVSTKTSVQSQSRSSPPPAATTGAPAILPSLTDDMFVVEAPSFIVPYVYEKPSIKPFREFVDKLGKELEEQKEKEEKERLKKEAEEKEKREKDRKERRERGEEVSDSEDETAKENAAEEKRKKKAAKKERRRRRNEEEDDASWDEEITSSSDDDDDTLSDDMEIIKDKDDSIEEVKEITDLTAKKVTTGKTDNYFDCSLGNFFVNIGLSLVQEHVQSDLLKQQNRKLNREKKSGQSTKETQSAIASLMKNLEFSKENNAPYAFPLKKCDFCSFKTESTLVLKHHLETPHMKNNLYKCNFCLFEVKSPHDILTHMEIMHKVRGKLERAPSYHQCSNCPFEDNGKGKLARHLVACAKKFKPDQNLAPPIEWEPPAKIPKITRPRNNVTSYQNAFNRQVNSLVRTPINIANLVVGNPSMTNSGFRARGRSPLVAPRGATIQGSPNILRHGIAQRQGAPAAILPNNLSLNSKSKSTHQPSISITPLPRHPPPSASLTPTQSKSTFVICEICDGYIKDLEQLRNHMQWIHKVKIHPKMIYNRPPLNCQKCQFRFFTDQGLERHLLGSHGLVTSSMQEAANKGKDAGRCPVCGRVYQWKLLGHVARDHNLTLKPAHLSYKCTVCTATFGMYKQFEAHVYSAHSVVAKRVMDKSKPPPTATPAKSTGNMKGLKINDEITIIPQPTKSATATRTK